MLNDVDGFCVILWPIIGHNWAVIPQKRWLQYGQDNPARSYAGDAGHQYQQWATGWPRIGAESHYLDLENQTL